LVVMPDADLDLAVEGAVFSGFAFAGQRCTSLGTVFVHRSVHDAFLERFARAVESAPIGDPSRDVLFGPLMSERFVERFLGYLEGIGPSHRTLGSPGAGRIDSDNPRPGFMGDPAEGLYVHPTIVDGVTADDELYRRETFGPLVGVAVFDDFD